MRALLLMGQLLNPNTLRLRARETTPHRHTRPTSTTVPQRVSQRASSKSRPDDDVVVVVSSKF
eukprot:1779403-Pyramimonas_sp.AAC.1